MAVTEHPDVILMDLEMPDDDRWEAVRRLKNDPQTRDIPIIGMSAHAVESERETAIATGCVDLVLPLECIAPALISLTMWPGAAELLRVPISPWATAPSN